MFGTRLFLRPGRLDRRLPAAVGLFMALLAVPLSAQQQALTPDSPLPLDPAVRSGELQNGVRYLIRQNGRPEGRAELRLVVDAGSILEEDDQLGLAHLVEHMAFNGTENFQKQELVDYLESIGMEFGPSINAYTSFDETVYMLMIPTDDGEIVETAFQILEDWAHGVTFDPEEVDKERGVVLEEWRLGRGAGARIRDRQFPVVLQDSRYAERLPIGDPEVLRTFPQDRLREFYRDWYRPDLMTVVAVGDFDPDAIEGLIRDHFQRLVPVEAPRVRETYDVPAHVETLYSVVSDPEATSTQVGIIFKGPARDESTIRAYRDGLMEALYDAMLNSRLNELAQKEDAPFAFAGAGGGRFARSTDAYQLFALVQEGGALEGMDALLTEAERAARHGFTPSELDRQKAELLRAYERAYAERDNQESDALAGELVAHALRGEPVPGIEAEYGLAQALLPTIRLEEVNALAQDGLGDESRVVTVSGPEGEDGPTLPTVAELAAIFEAVEDSEIEPYVDETPDAPLVAEMPAASPVVAEDYREDLNLTTWELANGVRVLVKPTTFKEDQVVFRGFSPGGYSLSTLEEHPTASRASSLVYQGGLGEFSAVDLQKVLAGKAASASPAIGPYSESVSGNGSPGDLETLFQLIYLNFTAPREDPEAFEAFRNRLRAFLANMGSSPNAAFSDTLAVTMAQHHPRVEPLTMEVLDELDLNVAMEFYRDRFADASDFTFVFVGSLDLEALRPLVETYLGGLPSTGRNETWRDMGIRPPSEVVRKTVRRGVEPQSQTVLAFTGDFEWSRENRLGMRALAGVLEIRLRELLREEMSGTYGVGVQGGYARIPESSYDFRIGFGSDPARTDELVEAMLGEIERFKEEGPTDEEVQKVLEAERRSRETNLQENGWWLSQLSFAAELGEDPGYLLDMSLFDSVTPESVRRDARRYLDLNRYVRVTLLPEGSEGGDPR